MEHRSPREGRSGAPTPRLRSVGPEDDDLLLRIYAGTRDDVLKAPWTEDDKVAFLRMQCDAQRADYERRFPGSVHSIVVVDGADVGRIWVDRRAGEIRLLDIALLPEHCGRGTGTALLRDLMAEAAREGRPLRHSVLRENEGAMRLYRRLGFVEVEDFGLYVLMEHALGS